MFCSSLPFAITLEFCKLCKWLLKMHNIWNLDFRLACDELIMKVVRSSFIVHAFYTQISCIENTFNTWINVLTNEIWIYEWMNVTLISHLLINLRVKCVFNARYQCVKPMNFEWINFAWFPSLSREMLSLWWSSKVLLLAMQAWVLDYELWTPPNLEVVKCCWH
jgi:hypothetical protein